MSPPSSEPTEETAASRPRWIDALALLALAGALNAAVWLAYHPRLSFSDEIVYATIARNVAGGRGLVASHYVPRSIIDKGHPSLYLHMPGHPLMLAPGIAALGPTQASVFVANWLSYAGVGLVLYALGCGVGGRGLGLLAALLYYACPTQLSLANTAMSQSTLALLTAGFLALWMRALRSPHWTRGLWLGGGLVVGMIHHETFVVLLPACVALAFGTRGADRWRYLAALAGAFAVLVALVFWPLHSARALQAHYAAGVLAGDLGAAATAMAENVRGNLVDLVSGERGGAAGTLKTQAPYLALAVLLACWRRLSGPLRWVLGFTASGFALMFLGLAPFYPVVRIGPKHLLLFVPGMCLLFAALLRQVRPIALARSVALVAVAGSAWLSYRELDYMMRGHQAGHYAREAALSRVIRHHTGALQPRTALVEGAFLYAWDAWPVDVVFSAGRIDLRRFDRLNERLPIDVVALPWSESDEDGAPRPLPIGDALVERGYAFVAHDEGLWIYVAPHLAAVRRETREPGRGRPPG